MNAPKGASGKPQRCLDYARHDRGGVKERLLDMTGGEGKGSEGATAPHA